MGANQTTFLADFVAAFGHRFGLDVVWTGGQAVENTASLTTHVSGRRAIGVKKAERFELGDITASYLGRKLIIEFESKELPLSNLLKYWPYVCGELSSSPHQPVLICHFSDWWSYATRRDLWEWTLSRMRVDPSRIVDIDGCQFDHGGADINLRRRSITAALEWIDRSANKGVDA